MLVDFVTMTIILLYYDTTLKSWPSSTTLFRLATQAIEIILGHNTVDTINVAEIRKSLIILLEKLTYNYYIAVLIPGTATAIAKWVTLQVRNHLEDILLVARSGTPGFGLSDNNDVETNKRIFRAATVLSAYLHRLHIPQFVGDLLVITKLLIF